MTGTTIDFAVLDSADIHDNSISLDNETQSLNSKFEPQTEDDLHCADHCLHHMAVFYPNNNNYRSLMSSSLIPSLIIAASSQQRKPATPPPLTLLM